MKYLILILVLVFSVEAMSQMELEKLHELRQEELMKSLKVKERVKLQDMRINYTSIVHRYYSRAGRLDSIKQVDPMWCTPCSVSEGGEFFKNWEMIRFAYKNDGSRIRTRERYNASSTEKVLSLAEIEEVYNRKSFLIDTLISSKVRAVSSYDNDNNIYSHYYVNANSSVPLKTVFRYDDNLNVISRVKYTSSPILANGSKYNASEISYYFYNEKNQRIKTIDESLGTDGSSTSEYTYYENGLLKTIKEYQREYLFEYNFFE